MQHHPPIREPRPEHVEFRVRGTSDHPDWCSPETCEVGNADPGTGHGQHRSEAMRIRTEPHGTAVSVWLAVDAYEAPASVPIFLVLRCVDADAVTGDVWRVHTLEVESWAGRELAAVIGELVTAADAVYLDR